MKMVCTKAQKHKHVCKYMYNNIDGIHLPSFVRSAGKILKYGALNNYRIT